MSTPSSTASTPSTPPDSLSGSSRKTSSTMGMGAALGLAIVLLIVGLGAGYYLGGSLNKSSSSSSNQIQLSETGSSLLYPLMKAWGPNYTSYNSKVVLSPASTGSGTGQSYAEQGLVNIGASDGYLSNASTTNLLNVPVAISAQLIYYNLAGVPGHLNLNGTLLAMIYAGVITTWNDSRILAAQSPADVTALNGFGADLLGETYFHFGDLSRVPCKNRVV